MVKLVICLNSGASCRWFTYDQADATSPYRVMPN